MINFKSEIAKIPTNDREEQIIKIVNEKFDKFVKQLKEDIKKAYIKNELNGHLAVNCLSYSECDEIIDKLAGFKDE